MTANGSGASARTSARPTWPAPNRSSGRRSSPKPSVRTPPSKRARCPAASHRLHDLPRSMPLRRQRRAAVTNVPAASRAAKLGDRVAPVRARSARRSARPGRRSTGRARGRARSRAISALRRRGSASAACARAIACHSSVPPPIVPVKPPSGWTTSRAPASRGAEPRVAATVTMAARPWRSSASSTRGPDAASSVGSAGGADRAHDRLRRRRRVEARHRPPA